MTYFADIVGIEYKENIMKKNYLYIIPLFLLEMIFQLAFFWLAPDCECKWIVYIVISAMTISHLVLSFVLTDRFGIRRSAATIVSGTFIQVIMVSAGVILLFSQADKKNAVFSMVLLALFYALTVMLFGFSIESSTVIKNSKNSGSPSINESPSPNITPNPRRYMHGNEHISTTPPPLPRKR